MITTDLRNGGKGKSFLNHSNELMCSLHGFKVIAQQSCRMDALASCVHGMLPLLLAHGIRSLQVERERGITVKAQSASMLYTHYPTESPIGESLSQADSPTGTLQPSAQRTHTDSAPSASSPSSFSTPPPPPSLSPPTYLLNLIDTRKAGPPSARSCRARGQPRRACYCWWTRSRACRRRRWPTSTSRATRGWQWCPSSTRSTDPMPTPRRSRRRCVALHLCATQQAAWCKCVCGWYHWDMARERCCLRLLSVALSCIARGGR